MYFIRFNYSELLILKLILGLMNSKSESSYESIDISKEHDEKDGYVNDINRSSPASRTHQQKFSKLWPLTATLAGVFFGVANIFLGKHSEYGAYSKEVA
jgi:hypothetical protein